MFSVKREWGIILSCFTFFVVGIQQERGPALLVVSRTPAFLSKSDGHLNDFRLAVTVFGNDTLFFCTHDNLHWY
jgi:hypothetical protein